MPEGGIRAIRLVPCAMLAEREEQHEKRDEKNAAANAKQT